MDCKYYEIDTHEKAEHDSWWNSMPDYAKKEYLEEEAHYEKHFPRSPYKFDNLPCKNFCTYFKVQDGFPGETLYCCSHKENSQILDGDSVFDGVDDPDERLRILDAIC